MKHRQLLYLHLIVLLLGGGAASRAQGVKKEVEVSIRQHQMPEKSLRLLADLLPEARRVRFYQETDGEKVSYESKLKWRGSRYSIEFYTDGSLMDIEKRIKFRSLPPNIGEQVKLQLEAEFRWYKVRRVQAQFSAQVPDQPDAEVIRKFMKNDYQNLTIRYEMEVDGKAGGEVGAYELLFDAGGALVKKRPIVRRPLDNLLY
jgi:hypothetical protein